MQLWLSIYFIALTQESDSNDQKNRVATIKNTVTDIETRNKSRHDIIVSKEDSLIDQSAYLREKADSINQNLMLALKNRERLVSEYRRNNARLSKKISADNKWLDSTWGESKILQVSLI